MRGLADTKSGPLGVPQCTSIRHATLHLPLPQWKRSLSWEPSHCWTSPHSEMWKSRSSYVKSLELGTPIKHKYRYQKKLIWNSLQKCFFLSEKLNGNLLCDYISRFKLSICITCSQTRMSFNLPRSLQKHKMLRWWKFSCSHQVYVLDKIYILLV